MHPRTARSGSGRVVGLDPSVVLPGGGSPAGSLTGNYEVDVSADSIADLAGSARLSLERSEFDGVQVFSSRGALRFADGLVHVDTLHLETSAATLNAHGALGLHGGVVDSLVYDASVDSLGGLRPFLASRASVQTGVPDSLAGAFALRGAVTGNLDSLNASGSLTGGGLYINKDRGATASGRFAFDDVLRAPHGLAAFELDTLVLAGVRVDTIGFEAHLAQAKTSSATGLQFAGTFNVGALSDNGPDVGPRRHDRAPGRTHGRHGAIGHRGPGTGRMAPGRRGYGAGRFDAHHDRHAAHGQPEGRRRLAGRIGA